MWGQTAEKQRKDLGVCRAINEKLPHKRIVSRLKGRRKGEIYWSGRTEVTQTLSWDGTVDEDTMKGSQKQFGGYFEILEE